MQLPLIWHKKKQSTLDCIASSCVLALDRHLKGRCRQALAGPACNNIQSIETASLRLQRLLGRRMTDWNPDLSRSDRPRYLAIADLLAADIERGHLTPGDRLPPQRRLASRLGIDFTTVARGYVEAQKRGLVHSRVGQGTFVRATPRTERGMRETPFYGVDLSMNLR